MPLTFDPPLEDLKTNQECNPRPNNFDEIREKVWQKCARPNLTWN